MTPIAAMLRELIAAGVTGDTLVMAVERIETSLKPRRSSGAERTAKWREKKKQNDTNKVTDVTDVTDVTSHVTPSLIEESKKEEEKEVRGRKRVAPLPESWKPPERAYALASELRLSVPEIEPRYRDYLAASGKMYADYDAGFCNFIRNTPRFSKPNGTNGHHTPRPGSKEDQRERTAEAYRQLSDYVDAHADESRRGRKPRPADAGFLPFAKPS